MRQVNMTWPRWTAPTIIPSLTEIGLQGGAFKVCVTVAYYEAAELTRIYSFFVPPRATYGEHVCCACHANNCDWFEQLGLNTNG